MPDIDSVQVAERLVQAAGFFGDQGSRIFASNSYDRRTVSR
jgi:hypothetical protein